ncbi:MAG: hypothetical protein PF904_14750 [Kiritimatiellae bacterium]|nr:hypothetical protein [Kiritimatiellia bacterium]
MDKTSAPKAFTVVITFSTINEHISNIYNVEKLHPVATIRKFRIVQTEGSRQVKPNNRKQLDIHYDIISGFIASAVLFFQNTAGATSLLRHVPA